MKTLFFAGLLFLVVPQLETTRFYKQDKSREKVFQHVFLGENANVLSVFPQCLIESVTPDQFDVTIHSLNWTEMHYEWVLRQRRISGLNVSTAVSINQLMDVNERDRTVTIAVRSITEWSDCRLTWSQSEFNRVSNITIPPSRFRSLGVFVPQLLLLEQTNPFASRASETDVRVTSLGTITVDQLYTTAISCSLDVEMYPFDSHRCNLTFETLFNSLEVSLNYPADQTVEDVSRHLLGEGRYVVSDTFQLVFLPPMKSRRWICTDIAFVGQNESENLHCFTDKLTFQLLLRRNPRFYIIHLFVPAFLCLLCSGIVFIITPGYMDKVFPSTFTLVSVLVFITATYAEMPETGTTLSWMSKYYFVCIFTVSLNCIYSSLSSTMAVSKVPVPKAMRKMVLAVAPVVLFDILPKRSRKPAETRVGDETGAEMKPLQVSEPGQQHASVQRAQSDSDSDSDSGMGMTDEPVIAWRHVIACLDRFYFLIVFPGSIATLITFICIGLNATANAYERFAQTSDWPYIYEQERIQRQSADAVFF